MKAIVLLSGGQDSTTALSWAVKMWGREDVLALSILYGQRHHAEFNSASFIASLMNVKHESIFFNEFGEAMKRTTALTGPGDVNAQSPVLPALPASFVPARNALFLTIAAGVMVRENASHIVTGVCQTDYSGYPDCRAEFITSIEKTLQLALGGREIHIHTPLMYLTKAETVHLINRNGDLWLLEYSLTCYNGTKPPCHTCPACKLRADGFEKAGIPDPLLKKKDPPPIVLPYDPTQGF